MRLTVSSTFCVWPWAESRPSTSTPASTRAATRSSTSAVAPMAAPTSRRPFSSRAELGYTSAFSMSLMVMRPFRWKSLSTMGSFSTLWRRRISLASARVVPSGAVTRFSLVITLSMSWLISVSNFMSRLVMIPMSLPLSQMGTPEMRNLAISSSASAKVWPGASQKGFVMTPFSERLTISTCSACWLMDIFLWMIPIPPSRAMAMAMRYSVTVSMAALISGIFRRIFFVSWVCRSTSAGRTSLAAGISRTSSKVSPCLRNFCAASWLTISYNSFSFRPRGRGPM